MLWLGRSDVTKEEEEKFNNEKQEFIDKLINFKDGCGEFYNYRAYFLAASGIAEFTIYPRKDDIPKQIFKSSLLFYSSYSITLSALAVMEETERETAINALLQLLSDKSLDRFTYWEAASSLGKIDPGNQQAINALVQLLSNKKIDNYTRRLAVSRLREFGSGSQEELNVLFIYDRDSRNLLHYNPSSFFNDSKKVPYHKFYEVWHQFSVANRVVRKSVICIPKIMALYSKLIMLIIRSNN